MIENSHNRYYVRVNLLDRRPLGAVTLINASMQGRDRVHVSAEVDPNVFLIGRMPGNMPVILDSIMGGPSAVVRTATAYDPRKIGVGWGASLVRHLTEPDSRVPGWNRVQGGVIMWIADEAMINADEAMVNNRIHNSIDLSTTIEILNSENKNSPFISQKYPGARQLVIHIITNEELDDLVDQSSWKRMLWDRTLSVAKSTFGGIASMLDAVVMNPGLASKRALFVLGVGENLINIITLAGPALIISHPGLSGLGRFSLGVRVNSAREYVVGGIGTANLAWGILRLGLEMFRSMRSDEPLVRRLTALLVIVVAAFLFALWTSGISVMGTIMVMGKLTQVNWYLMYGLMIGKAIIQKIVIGSVPSLQEFASGGALDYGPILKIIEENVPSGSWHAILSGSSSDYNGLIAAIGVAAVWDLLPMWGGRGTTLDDLTSQIQRCSEQADVVVRALISSSSQQHFAGANDYERLVRSVADRVQPLRRANAPQVTIPTASLLVTTAYLLRSGRELLEMKRPDRPVVVAPTQTINEARAAPAQTINEARANFLDRFRPRSRSPRRNRQMVALGP